MPVPSLHSRRIWIEEMVQLRVLGFLFRVCMPVLEGLAIEELLWYATALGGLQKKGIGTQHELLWDEMFFDSV